MKTIHTILASLLITSTLACDVESADVSGRDLDARQSALDVEDEALPSWEAEKLDEADATLLLDHAGQLGFDLVDDLSFSYPIEGIVLAELEGPGDQPAFLSFDVDDAGATLLTTLIVPDGDGGEPDSYWVVDREVAPAGPGAAATLGLAAPEMPVENECHTWGHCDCVEFAAAVTVCLIHGFKTGPYYDCIRALCE